MDAKKHLLVFFLLISFIAEAQFNKTYQFSSSFKFSVPRPGTKAIHSSFTNFPFISETTAMVTLVDSSTSGSFIKRVLFQKFDINGNVLCSKTYQFTASSGIKVNALTRTNDGGYLIVGQGDYSEASVVKSGILVVRVNSNCDVIFSHIYEISSNNGPALQRGEGFTINKTNEATEQYIISGFQQLNDASRLIHVLKIKADGTIVWFKKITPGFSLLVTDPYATVYRSDLNRLIIFGIGVPSVGNKFSIRCLEVNQFSGLAIGSTREIGFEGIDTIDALSAVYSTKSGLYYLAFAGSGGSIRLNKTGLFLTQLNAQFNVLSTRQFLVNTANKIVSTGCFIQNKGTAGQIDSIDVSLEETRGNIVKNALMSVRSGGQIIAYRRFKSSSIDKENIRSSSLFVSNGNYFMNAVEPASPARTKLIKFRSISATNTCVNTDNTTTTRLFTAFKTETTPTTTDLGAGNGIIVLNTTTGNFTPSQLSCTTVNPQNIEKGSNLQSEHFRVFPTLIKNGQTTVAITASKLVKANCLLTITDAMGIIRLQKALQPDLKQWQLQLPNLPTGLYYVNITTAQEQLYKTTIVVE